MPSKRSTTSSSTPSSTPSKQQQPPPPSSSTLSSSTTTSSTQPSTKPASASSRSSSSTTIAAGSNDASAIAAALYNTYWDKTPQRVKLLDAFMAFLVVVGGLQFLYCVAVGNYPFNAFLSGFSATVGQFVLTASLRMQTNEENRAEFTSVGPERAFADFVFGSLTLHFFCVNFIN
ncbi:MAG: hypothetical protein LQ344_004675 [Seirophora lacunosa]|nr:MAG: hypothetical protein LQ344_004675 [Seirophora lacunosa]